MNFSLIFYIGLPVLLILLSTIYLWWRGKGVAGKPRAGSSIIIAGGPDSGKTLLFSKLLTGRTVQTVRTIAPNQGVLKRKSDVAIVDIPFKYWQRHELFLQSIPQCSLPSNCIILYLIDGTNIVKSIQADLKNIPLHFVATKANEAQSRGRLLAKNLILEVNRELGRVDAEFHSDLASQTSKDEEWTERLVELLGGGQLLAEHEMLHFHPQVDIQSNAFDLEQLVNCTNL